ncbi:MAG: DUF934 domain-containing protein [Polyangiaceae bacterium]|nr:DUF934 domain-containing protein [Polyangiaceae bacterium]MCW5789436.1 DUF934 domain-containing protein [Polyangiaceae bacterium]
MLIIQDRAIVDDSFTHLDDDTPIPSAGDVTVTLSRLQSERERLAQHTGRVGVRLKSDQLPTDVAAELPLLDLIMVEFPKFTDGRGYTTGRLLRDRYGYQGELRAFGHVLRDQLFYMARCGYTSFVMAPGRSLESALEAFNDFSQSYQAAADERRPLFRRIAR